MSALLSLLLSVPKGEAGIGLPRDISLEGNRIDTLLIVTTVFVTILFVIMVAWMAVAVLKHNGQHKADADHGTSSHSTLVAMVVSCVVFAIVDGNLFYHAIVDLKEAFWNWDRVATADTVRIEVNARQWAWEARYAGEDGVFATDDDVVTLNEVRVPADRPIFVQIRSVDVIHSFYLPNLRVKTDATPGMTNQFWFQVDSAKVAQAGTQEFDVACAQHCGTHHYKMMATLTVMDGREFADWSREASINAKLDYDAAANDKYGPHWGWNWKSI
jgi:cytochrome c oxidase subunit 2